ncbi:hypothetical protein ACFPFV_12570 [Salinicoccus siamensis]|uniref:hypothetical protein n=1 Tax=Salinicoccus siamensis TaxID=381830 RepID=UPI0036166C33
MWVYHGQRGSRKPIPMNYPPTCWIYRRNMAMACTILHRAAASFIEFRTRFGFDEERHPADDPKVDLPSIVLSTFGLGGLLYGFSIAGTRGWTDLS